MITSIPDKPELGRASMNGPSPFIEQQNAALFEETTAPALKKTSASSDTLMVLDGSAHQRQSKARGQPRHIGYYRLDDGMQPELRVAP